MSNERFDRLMKKNLESVRPAYQPRAWNRFQKRLPAIGIGAWLLRYGGWLLSGLMLGGWLTTLYTFQENQQLLNQLNTRLANIETRSTAAALESQRNVQVQTKTDTIYLVKRTIVEHRYALPAANPTVGDNNGVDKLALKQSISDKPVTQPTAEDDSTDATIPAVSTKRTPIRSTAKPSGIAVNADNQHGNKKRLTDQKQRIAVAQPASAVETPQLSASPIDGNDNKSLVAQPDSSATEAKPLTETDSLVSQPVAQVATQNTASAPKTVQASSAAPQKSRTPFHLSTLKPRIGIETVGMVNGVGVGPLLEMFPMDNLGLSVGIQASALFAENHHELQDFNSATGQEFIEQYQSYLPAQYDRIREISMQTSMVNLPISLTYYVPLRNRWSVLFQMGTRFNLSAYQEVHFESYLRGEESHRAFETGLPVPFFNNFAFGSGIQYRWSRFSGQLSPYFLYNFKNTQDKVIKGPFGVKASIWLNLFK